MILSLVAETGMFMDFTNAVSNLVCISIRVLFFILIFASAFMHKKDSLSSLIWGVFAFAFPILTTIVFFFVYSDKKKKVCNFNDPCMKRAFGGKKK